MKSSVKRFLEHEAAGGIVLVIATLVALIFANSSLSNLYDSIVHTHFTIRFADFAIDETLHFWVNDALMAIFFFLIGLELKREVCEGELRRPSQVVLPMVAAVGGVVVPALIFSAFAWGDSFGMRGWAIPTATDIAFSLGVLSLLGSRVPNSLNVFLMTLAIIDDLAAIVIIAIFYTDNLSIPALSVAFMSVVVLAVINHFNIRSRLAYIIVSAVLWLSILHSGVHATIAGVISAMFIPITKTERGSMLKNIEDDLHGLVAFGILPLFAFVNAGVSLHDMDFSMLSMPVPAGIALGLFLGKQIGVFSFSLILIKSGLAKLPQGASWLSFYGVAVLCGIGFTMSLFVNGLAYGNTNLFAHTDRLAILLGSLVSGIVGYAITFTGLPKEAHK